MLGLALLAEHAGIPPSQPPHVVAGAASLMPGPLAGRWTWQQRAPLARPGRSSCCTQTQELAQQPSVHAVLDVQRRLFDAPPRRQVSLLALMSFRSVLQSQR